MRIAKHVMVPGDVARALGVTVRRVRQLDDELHPVQLDSGHRRYNPAVVARVAKRRGVRATR